MAYKVLSIEKNQFNKTANCQCYADTKTEANSGDTPEGLPEGYTIAPGSIVRTGSWEVGTMKSNGSWGWA